MPALSPQSTEISPELVQYVVRFLPSYMEKVTFNVERKIKFMLSSRFALDFDGRTEGDTHYVAIFASIPSENRKGLETYFWSFLSYMKGCHRMLISRNKTSNL